MPPRNAYTPRLPAIGSNGSLWNQVARCAVLVDTKPDELTATSPPAESGDDVLVARAAGGDQEAYAALVRRYTPIAHRTATLIAGPNDAEDAVQEAFVRAFYALRRFRSGAPFKPWLLAIVANCARTKRRTIGQQSRIVDRLSRRGGPLHLVPSAEATVLDASARHRLVAAIDALPTNARLVVTCRYLLDLSEAETAQVLGWPAGTVKSRLSRALDRLRGALTEGATEGSRQ
jgi:RNA polymerase sigma-70 factor (ECF subfamily)